MLVYSYHVDMRHREIMCPYRYYENYSNNYRESGSKRLELSWWGDVVLYLQFSIFVDVLQAHNLISQLNVRSFFRK
jgi:hypothetical protein